jgi:hypothetical protein
MGRMKDLVNDIESKQLINVNFLSQKKAELRPLLVSEFGVLSIFRGRMKSTKWPRVESFRSKNDVSKYAHRLIGVKRREEAISTREISGNGGRDPCRSFLVL